MFWHRWNGTAAQPLHMFGSGFANFLLTLNGNGTLSGYDLTAAAPRTPNNAFSPGTNTWVHYALVYDRGTNFVTLYCTPDEANATNRVQLFTTNWGVTSDANVTRITLGRHDDAASSVGEFRYARYFSVALTAAEIETERKSPTAVRVAAITVGDWPLASQTDTADLQDIGALTFTSAGTLVVTDADEPVNVSAAAAPVLTLPTGSATGNTTGTAGATTNTASGTMYALARIGGAAASAATIVASGTALAITTTGAKTIPLTVLTTGSAYTVDVCHASAAGNSNVVTTAATFTPSTLTWTGTYPAQSCVAGAAFTHTGTIPTPAGGIGTKTYSATGLGTSGLTVNATTGQLQGSGGTAGSYAVTPTVTDSSTAGTNPSGGGAPPQTVALAAFTLTISAPGPTITTQPTAQTVSEGATAAFTVAATGTGTLTYQWQLAAPGSVTYGNVVGATGATHTTAATVCATDHGASYRCNVTDSAGTTTTGTALLTVNAVTSTSRPGADVTVTGWTASTGVDLFAMIDETVAADADFITSPTLTGTTAPATFALAYPLAAGDWVLGVRARVLTGTATLRLYLINAAGTVVGTSAAQALTNVFATYTLAVTASAVANRARVEVITP